MRHGRSGPGAVWHIVEFIQRLVDAWRHVRSGGQTTRRRAVRRATAPPRACPTCHQPVPHSTDWRDHIELGQHDI